MALVAATVAAQRATDFGAEDAVREFPELKRVLTAAPAVSSALADASTPLGVPVADFYPVTFSLLERQPRTAEGIVTLAPGAWESRVEVYNIQPGGVVHEAGEGYVVAPLKGPGAETISLILRRAFARPQVPRSDVQALLWAVVSRAPVTQSRLVRNAATQLLTAEEIAAIDAARLERVPPGVRTRLLELLEAPLAQRVIAEAEFRELSSAQEVTYELLEREANTQGPVTSVMGDRDLLEGRWSHEQGVFVRPAPTPPHSMALQVIVPSGRLPQIVRDERGRIRQAIYGNGLAITASYEDFYPPASVTADGSTLAYRFSRLDFISPALEKPVSVQGTGWTLVGWKRGTTALTDAANSAALQSLPGYQQRFQDTLWWANGLDVPLARTTSGREASVTDAVDDHAFRDGVRQALTGTAAEARVIPQLNLVPFEWLHCRLAACTPASAAVGTTRSLAFDPTRIVVVPGNQLRQRLMTSGRSLQR